MTNQQPLVRESKNTKNETMEKQTIKYSKKSIKKLFKTVALNDTES